MAISAAEAFFGMGTMFGPSLGGFLYEYGGFALPFWISGTGTGYRKLIQASNHLLSYFNLGYCCSHYYQRYLAEISNTALSSVVEPEPPGAATFRAAPEPNLIFLVGAESRSCLFKAVRAPAGSFRQAKNKSLVLVSSIT